MYNKKEYSDFYFRESHLFHFSEKTLDRLMKKFCFECEIKTIESHTSMNYMHWILEEDPQKILIENGMCDSLLFIGSKLIQ